MDDLVQWLSAQFDEDERIARAASGWTVVDEAGRWQTSPNGDEWEAFRTDCDEDELLAALRPGLPRPPDVMSGLWGAVVSFRPEFEATGAASPLAAFQHAARHDPARVLREIDATRQLVAAYTTAVERVEELTALIARLRARDEDQFMSEMERATAIHKRDVLYGVLQVLALPYADRPGYREEWRL